MEEKNTMNDMFEPTEDLFKPSGFFDKKKEESTDEDENEVEENKEDEE